MSLLIASLGLLVLSHAVPSHPVVRMRLLALAGPWLFYVGYSLLSLLALSAVIVSYGAADPSAWVHLPTTAARYAAVLLMPAAIFLVVCRLTQPPRRWEGRGIYRVTTDPGSLGILLWSLLHLANVGALRTFLLFAAMALIAVVSLVKHGRGGGVLGALPLARQALALEPLPKGEIGSWRPLTAVAAFAALVLLHPIVIGPDPLLGVLN